MCIIVHLYDVMILVMSVVCVLYCMTLVGILSFSLVIGSCWSINEFSTVDIIDGYVVVVNI